METGSIVKFSKILEPGDADLRMRVIEVKGDRVLVVALVNLPIQPTYTFSINDLVEVK